MTQIKFLVPKDWDTDKKGDFFEKEIGKLLSKIRFEIIQRIRFTGMEIDLLAKNKDIDQTAFVECKFIADPLGADEITKLFGKAYIKKINVIYLFSTSEPGKEARGLIDEYEKTSAENRIKFAFVGPEKLGEMYFEITNKKSILEKFESIPELSDKIGNTKLIISPEQVFWVCEYILDGFPNKLLIFSFNENEKIRIENIRKLLNDNKMLLGLECEDGTPFLTGKNIPGQKPIFTHMQETISTIPQADQFDDYRPCRPMDFIGRRGLQKEIWDFLIEVKGNNTNTRLISLVGQSGFGKSSLILKLSDRFKNPHWKSRFFLYHIDTRSAVTPLFVVEAIRKGFEEAKKQNFIEISEEISIDNFDDPLESKSIKKALEYLKSENKVIILFFDQFEELFIKDELFHVFENFKKLSLQVDAIKENIVLGSSWRTGISLPEDHPAYHMWHELSDRRKTFTIEKFDSSEISQQLQQLSEYLGEHLENQLKRRLIEHCSGFPWLLKKLCIHIFRQVKKGIKQTDLIYTQFNLKQLFDEDTVDLTATQMECLRYIAKFSPISVIELNERFDDEIVNILYMRRLIIRTGHRYAIYWDIFRDYINEGKLPVISLTIIPTSPLGTIMKSIQIFEKYGELSKEDFANHLQIADKTATNVISDLITFLIVKKSDTNTYHLTDEIKGKSKSTDTVANHLYHQFLQHKIIQEILNKEGDGAQISVDKFQSYLAISYSSLGLSPQSIKSYSQKLFQWFSFCGLMEIQFPNIKFFKSGTGAQKGIITRRGTRGASGKIKLFLASAPPQNTAKLISLVISNDKITRSWISDNKMRNTVVDAIALEILEWRENVLTLTEKYKDRLSNNGNLLEINKILREEANNSFFISKLKQYLSSTKSVSQIGDEISAQIGRTWAEKSKSRYILSGLNWIRVLELDDSVM